MCLTGGQLDFIGGEILRAASLKNIYTNYFDYL